MAEGKFNFEELLADPDFRKMLDDEVRARVRERLRLRSAIHTAAMIVALVLAAYGLWQAGGFRVDMQEAQSAVAEAQSLVDATTPSVRKEAPESPKGQRKKSGAK